MNSWEIARQISETLVYIETHVRPINPAMAIALQDLAMADVSNPRERNENEANLPAGLGFGEPRTRNRDPQK